MNCVYCIHYGKCPMYEISKKEIPDLPPYELLYEGEWHKAVLFVITEHGPKCPLHIARP